MQIIEKKISELIPYARNARTHSDAQIAQIAGAIREFGFLNPILLDGDLDQMGFDLGLTGFSEAELNRLMTDLQSDEAEDDLPELEEVAITRPGDVWLLGKHRLMCGDSTSADDVGQLLAGVEPHLMITDPPYGVAYDASWREGVDLGIGKRNKGKVLNDDRVDWREAWALFPGSIAYVWHGGLHTHTVAESLTASGFKLRTQIIWAKQHFVLSRGDYHWQHEPCWYAVRDTGHWVGDRRQTTIWDRQQ